MLTNFHVVLCASYAAVPALTLKFLRQPTLTRPSEFIYSKYSFIKIQKSAQINSSSPQLHSQNGHFSSRYVLQFPSLYLLSSLHLKEGRAGAAVNIQSQKFPTSTPLINVAFPRQPYIFLFFFSLPYSLRVQKAETVLPVLLFTCLFLEQLIALS